MDNSKQIAALLLERVGYAVRNLDERVAAVDKSLKALGYKTEKKESAALEPSAERAIMSEPGKRKK